MGVVLPPFPDHNFDGKICNIRVSKLQKYDRGGCHQNFSDVGYVNAALKDGEWTELVVDNMTLGDLKEVLQQTYDLDDEIVQRLALRYYRTDKNEKEKPHYISKDTAWFDRERFAFKDISLVVKTEKGDERQVDCSCDSDFMKEAMVKVGEATRAKFYWVARSQTIYLFMDNAGGHGTKEIVAAYVAMLKRDFNITVIFQRPRSPATNMLDLGIWMAIQSLVEKEHFGQRKEVQALWRSVERGWEGLEEEKLLNVYKRWRFVLDLIIEDEGGDHLVESRRGKLFSVPSDEVETMDDEDNEDEAIAKDAAIAAIDAEAI